MSPRICWHAVITAREVAAAVEGLHGALTDGVIGRKGA